MDITHLPPYDSVEDAFFSMANRQRARADGANGKGYTGTPRRGTGLDIEIIINRLYKNGQLSNMQMRLMRYCGRTGNMPDRAKPSHDELCDLWADAMEKLQAELEKKHLL